MSQLQPNNEPEQKKRKTAPTAAAAAADPRDEAIERVMNFDIEDTKMNRAVIRRLVQAGGGGDRIPSLTRGGDSKSANNKAKATSAHATNGLARLLAAHAPHKANEIREAMMTTAVIKIPDLSNPDAAAPSTRQSMPHKKARMRQDLPADCGWMMRDLLRNMKPGRERRPFLACLSYKYTKEGVEDFLGITISHKEWSLIRSHPNASATAEANGAHPNASATAEANGEVV